MRIDLQTWQKKTLGVLIVVAAIAMVLVSVGATFMGLRRHAFVLYPQRAYNGPDVYSHSNGMASSPVVVVPTKGSFNPYTSAQPSAYTGSAYSRPAPSASPMAVAVPLKTTSVTTHNRTAAPLGKGSAGVVTTSSRTTHSVGGGGVNGGMATTSSRSGNNQSQGLTPSAGSSIAFMIPQNTRKTLETRTTPIQGGYEKRYIGGIDAQYASWLAAYLATGATNWDGLKTWFDANVTVDGDMPELVYKLFEDYAKSHHTFPSSQPLGDCLLLIFLCVVGYVIYRDKQQRLNA